MRLEWQELDRRHRGAHRRVGGAGTGAQAARRLATIQASAAIGTGETYRRPVDVKPRPSANASYGGKAFGSTAAA